MSVIINDNYNYEVLAKGSPESIIDICNIDQDIKANISTILNNMTNKGMRVLGLANKNISANDWEEIQNKNDFIINTTYTNPNLGIKNNKFNLKYELCIIPVVKNFWNKLIQYSIKLEKKIVK